MSQIGKRAGLVVPGIRRIVTETCTGQSQTADRLAELTRTPRILRTPGLVAVGTLAVVAGVFANSSAAVPPSLYKGTATKLIPMAIDAGYEQLTSRTPGTTRATASYSSSDPSVGTGTISIEVFKVEAGATAKWGTLPGTVARMNGWWLKWSFQVGSDRLRTVSIVGHCRNLVVAASRAALDNRDHLTKRLKIIVDDVFAKAIAAGMTACGSSQGAAPPSSAKKYYWTESEAEAMVVQKVRLPYCTVWPNDSDCRAQSAWPLEDARCRGIDELGTTFRFNRFTCDVVASYRYKKGGRIAVWVTGLTTLRWQLI